MSNKRSNETESYKRIRNYIKYLEDKWPTFNTWKSAYDLYCNMLAKVKEGENETLLGIVKTLGENLLSSYGSNLRSHLEDDRLSQEEKESITKGKKKIKNDLDLFEEEKLVKERIGMLTSNIVNGYPFWSICYTQYKTLRYKAISEERDEYDVLAKKLGIILYNVDAFCLIPDEKEALEQYKREIEEYLGKYLIIQETVKSYKEKIKSPSFDYEVWQSAYDYYNSILNEAISNKDSELFKFVILLGKVLLNANFPFTLIGLSEEERQEKQELFEIFTQCKRKINNDLCLFEEEKLVRAQIGIMVNNVIVYPLWHVYYTKYKTLRLKGIKEECEGYDLLADKLGRYLAEAEVHPLIPDEEVSLNEFKKDIKKDLGKSNKLA